MDERAGATLDAARTALLVIDVQRAFDEWEAEGRARNNPGADAAVARLLGEFRKLGAPVIHVRHASREMDSKLRPDAPGFRVKECAREVPGEPVLLKHVNSAFIGTDLERRLRAAAVSAVVVCGITTNHCVETTTRMAGNLGFRAMLSRDACYAFEMTGADGEQYSAEAVHAMTLANLSGEFAEIVTAAQVLARMRVG